MTRLVLAPALAGAMAAALALTLSPTYTRAADAKMEQMMKDAMAGIAAGKIEKCYAVAKSGQNDCKTATASCAGSSTKNADASAFLMVPAGTCAKIVGGASNPA